MKNLFSTLIISFLTLQFMQAQVLEDTRVLAMGSQPALTIVLPGVETKFVDAAWKEFLKPYGKVTRVKQSKEYVAEDIQVLEIGGVNRIDIYSLTENVSEGTKMIAWIDLGPGFINSEAYPKEYVASVQFLKKFASKVQVDMITNELEEQQKLVTKSENNLTKLQREKEILDKIIEDSKKRIAQAEKDIEKNLKDQELAQKEIEVQKEALGGVQKKLDDCKNQ